MRAKRRGKTKNTNLILLMLLFIIVANGVILTGFLSNAKSTSKTEDQKYKYYTSIQLEEGDSLWAIAEQYMTLEYDDIVDYIAEVKSINSLSSNHITAGSFLTVPYYSMELK